MKIVSLIPARGGSKGIKKKNLQKYGNDSLIGHKIKQASESICDEVWITSDDQEIIDEASKYGAKVLKRPGYLATDETSTDAVIMHAIRELKLNDEDILVLLQPTSPLLTIKSINSCIEKLISEKDLSSVITIRESHPFMWKPKQDGKWEPKNHSREKRLRRQEMSEEGWETGGCYAMRISETLLQSVRYPYPTGVVKVSHIESLDIDTSEDLEAANRVTNI